MAKAKKVIKKPIKKTTSSQELKIERVSEGEHIRTFSRETILPYLASILLIGSGVLVFIVYRSYLWPLFIATILYMSFDGVNRYFIQVFRGNRSLSAAFMLFIVFFGFLGAAAYLVRQLVSQLIELVRNIQATFNEGGLLEYAEHFPFIMDNITQEPFFWMNLTVLYREYLGEVGKYLDPDKVASWLGGFYTLVSGGLLVTADVAFTIILSLIILFFLFRDGPRLYLFLEASLPFPPPLTRRFSMRMAEILKAVLRGSIFVSILQGFALGIGFSFAGVGNGALYGFVAGIFSLIPIVGTAIVWAPAVLYLFFIKGSWGAGIFLLAWCLSFYLFLENIFKPKILDKKLGMHPLLLFLAIVGGLSEFGVPGVILGPLFVTLFMTIWSIYHIWGAASENTLPNLPDEASR